VATNIRTTLGSTPLDGRAFRWRMGVKALDPAEWLQIDNHRESDLREKEHLLSSCFDDVVAFAGATNAAESEVFKLAADALGSRGISPKPLVETHPLVDAARGIQEDVCLLEKRQEQWILTAGVICFPTRWSLTEKIGRPIREIHAPVPGIDSISPIIDRFFDRMNRGSLVVRSNWSLTDDPSLRLEPKPTRTPTELPADPAADVWLRVERQTVRKLSASGAICFTIRVHRWALGDVIEQLPAESIAASLSTIPIEVAEYKDVAAMREGLIGWLRDL